ncbi:MAG TPA: ATP-dependent Clp protease adaptor ClpS [Bacteroidales bacterium]|nr:ATP-dependent Clp protease adaptor ClpS [Bacteroidales bacterium]
MTKGAPFPWGSMRGQDEEKSLLLINDDINTFNHVINSLVEVCGHDEMQAEQCAVLTHHKGGCVIKVGDAQTLEQLSAKLKELHLDTIVV